MKTTAESLSSSSHFPSALRRDSTLSTNNIKRERLESRRTATGERVGFLSFVDQGIIWSLVVTRVMTRDQIQRLWYPRGTTRVVNWRLRRLKERKLIKDLPNFPQRRKAWAATERGLRALEEELLRRDLDLGIRPPDFRKIEPTTMYRQFEMAEIFLNIIKQVKEERQMNSLENIIWQPGKRQGFPFYYGVDRRNLRPTIYFGARRFRHWWAFVQMEHGFEKTKWVRETFEKYAKYCVLELRTEKPPTLIYVCPNEDRCAFARKIFNKLDPAWQQELSACKIVTPEGSIPILRRYLAYGAFFGELRGKLT